VILDDWRREDRDGRVVTSMRLRSPHGDARVSVAIPPGCEGPAGDASPFVAMTLPVALNRLEDVDVDGAVSARLLRGAERAVATCCAWNPALRPAAVRGAAVTPPPPRAAGAACLLSRGVDSLFSAAVERQDPAPLTHLLHWRGLEPRHGPATADAEVAACQAIAERLGLPLLVGETDVRAVVDRDAHFHDSQGFVLAGLGLAVSGAAGLVVIPGTDSPRSLGPMGSSPILDSHLSTEWAEVAHDASGLGRVDKIAALAAQRPDLLAHLKVCWAEDRPDNCSRCGKCVLTMCALAAAGALEQATGFGPLPLALVRAQRPSPLRARHEWAETLLALGTTGRQGELRAAMAHALRRTARPGPSARARAVVARARGERARLHPSWRAADRGFDWAASTRALALLHHGAPEGQPSHSAVHPPPQPRLRTAGDGEAAPNTVVGLMRAVDRRERRHSYAAGRAPVGVPAGELGALLVTDPGGGVALWLDAEGRPATRADRPRPPVSGAMRVRWVLAPLRFAAVPARARARGVVRRLADTVSTPRTAPAPPPSGAPAGFLHSAPAPGRVALYAAEHPVLDDRLLTTRRAEAADLGYGEPALVGYLAGEAPLTGTLEPPPADVPWAHRFGLARRRGA
jgi:hypothetical protein